MKTKLIKALAVVALCLAQGAWGQVWNGKIDAEWYFENTEAAEFTIATGEQLAGLAQLVNGGNNFYGKTIILGANILLNDTTDWEKWYYKEKNYRKIEPANTWTPIGLKSVFAGIFDGGGHIISGIYINNEMENQGLFGLVNRSTTIKNLGITASFVRGKSYVGSLVGMNHGTITNCYSTGNIQRAENGEKIIGGLVGDNRGTITDSYTTGNVEGYISGGLAGKNSGTITNCYATGNVKDGGGLVGKNSGTITNCYATGNVNGTTSGGLVGENSGTITNSYATGYVEGNFNNNGGLVGENKGGIIADCHATGNVRASGSCVNCGGGGLVGSNNGGTITNCYATGDVQGIDVGGLIGNNYGNGIIMNCHATGNIKGSGEYGKCGGLVGSNSGKIVNSYAVGSVQGRDVGGLIGGNSGTITNCYATGNVKGAPSVDGYEAYGNKNYGGNISNVGGLIGKNENSVITNCYAIGDINGDRNTGGLIGISDKSSITNCYSAGNVSGTTGNTIGGLIGTNNGSQIKNSYYDRQASGQVDIVKGESKSTAQMKQQEIFQGWDFNNVWGIEEDKNNGYPYLQLKEIEFEKILTDTRDGKKYKVIKIGDQIWMSENLNYDTKNSYSECYDKKPANCKKYGRLYSPSLYGGGFEGYCPSGWHVPSNNEWTLLFNTIGNPAGQKLKAKSGWNKNGNGTDEFGFTALPGGVGNMSKFSNVGSNGIWWSSSNYKDYISVATFYYHYISIGYDYEYVKWDRNHYGQHSIRCVKD